MPKSVTRSVAMTALTTLYRYERKYPKAKGRKTLDVAVMERFIQSS
jgi:hypothetical protein